MALTGDDAEAVVVLGVWQLERLTMATMAIRLAAVFEAIMLSPF